MHAPEPSIAELDRFIDSQRSALGILQGGIETLERLRSQAIAQPETVLENIINNVRQSAR
jgi:hypothetical protein